MIIIRGNHDIDYNDHHLDVMIMKIDDIRYDGFQIMITENDHVHCT